MRRIATVPLLLFLTAGPLSAAGPQVERGTAGAVAAAEETAARVGINILKWGGNAADAAVAISFALAVTWPEAGNIGGGGFWISRDANGKVLVIDYREVAPRAARSVRSFERRGKAALLDGGAFRLGSPRHRGRSGARAAPARPAPLEEGRRAGDSSRARGIRRLRGGLWIDREGKGSPCPRPGN